MKLKPTICLIDEDENVNKGWQKNAGQEAQVIYFPDHLELLNANASDRDLIPSFSCIIIGRYFKNLSLDVVSGNLCETLKNLGAGPIFLNWQGYITKDEVNAKFDGKLFHRYGVKWQTLRLRIQKFEKQAKSKGGKEFTEKQLYKLEHKGKGVSSPISRPEKCLEILKTMAKNSYGEHRKQIEFYATQDQNMGMKLLEAIYNRLLTDKNRPSTCPSQYINSSPVIAQRILHDALFG